MEPPSPPGKTQGPKDLRRPNNMDSHNNQDIFRAACEKDSLAFRVWYGTSEQNHTKGFFSKIEVLEKSSETILEKVKGLIYGF